MTHRHLLHLLVGILLIAGYLFLRRYIMQQETTTKRQCALIGGKEELFAQTCPQPADGSYIVDCVSCPGASASMSIYEDDTHIGSCCF